MSEHDRQAGEAWAKTFEQHAGRIRLTRKMLRRLPRDPRCKFCYAPFAGFGGRVAGLRGRRQSRKNPHLCDVCVERGPAGGIETEGGILFADVRGFTTLAESRSPTEVAELMQRYYSLASDVLVARDAVVDKFVGDEVMALFWPPLVEGEAVEAMVAAGEELLHGVGVDSAEGPWLPVGIGMDFGPAFIGNIGTSDIRDFTALGDVVNTASRLQGCATAGQMVLSDRVYAGVQGRYPDAEPVTLDVRGRSEPVAAHVIEVATAAAS